APMAMPRLARKRVPSNNAMNLTRSSQTDCRPCRLLQCSTDVDEPTATAVGTSKRISVFVGCTEILVGSTPSNPRSSYGGILEVAPGAKVGAVVAPWPGQIGEERGEGLGTTSTPSNK